MPPRRKERRVRPVIFIAAEGYVEEAFLSVAREYYSVPRYKVVIDNRRGGSSDMVVNYACGEAGDHFITAAVIDSDRPLSQRSASLAMRRNVKLIINDPCIEGTLLSILNIGHGDDSHECKRLFAPHIGATKTTFRPAHRHIFPKEVLNEARERVAQLDEMIKVIEGVRE